MRRNPMLMTVIGANPGRRYRENPFVLIDSRTLKIIRNWKGSMMDRKPWDWAQEAARRLNRDVFVVAHPYVPQGFKAGVEVSKMFFAGGPWQVVSPDGSARRGDWDDLPRQNPGFGPSIIGGMVGAFTTHALSNPASGPLDETAARELELYIDNDADLYHRQFVPIVKNLMKRRALGTYDRVKAIKLFMYLIDNGARKYVREFGTHGQRVDAMFNRATRLEVARRFRDSFETEAGLGNYDRMTFGVSDNPRASRKARSFMSSRIPRLIHEGYPQKQAVAIAYSEARRRGMKANPRRTRTRKNPGMSSRKKITMSIQKFAKIIRKKNDRKLWNDFVKKVKGYHAWSHGTWPTKVTIEVVKKAGVSGIWIAYDMGKEPEKTYIMPKGTKRKGAWKHPWTRMPSLKGDPEAGIILTKMVPGNKITDFLHG